VAIPVPAALVDDRVQLLAPIYQVRTRYLPARPTAVVRAEVRPASVTHWLIRAHAHVRDVLSGAGVSATGPPFARFIADDEAGDRPRVEAGYQVAVAIGELDDVVASGLPAGTVAVTRHEGPHESLDAAYAALDGWLSGHGFIEAGPHWEVYLTDGRDGTNPARWRTDVIVPYG